MKHRSSTLVAMMAAGALALTGCSGSSGDDGTVTLQMVETLTNPARQKILKELITGFEDENPGVTVELVSPPTEQAVSTVQQMLQAGNGVDVLEVQDSTVGSFSANNWLYDMHDDLADWDGDGHLDPQEALNLRRIAVAQFQQPDFPHLPMQTLDEIDACPDA